MAEKHTIYGAEPAEGAYAETLAWARVKLDALLSDLFPESDDPKDARTLQEIVEQEWADVGFMEPGHLAAGWRRERNLYQLKLPHSGWFVDVQHSETLSAVTTALGSYFGGLGVDQLTLSHLTGEDRRITTEISQWIRAQTLDDGSRPHGITFYSKHGADWTCWAIWLRGVDEGGSVSSEPTKSDEGTEIKPPAHNPQLETVARLFKLTIF